MCTQASYRAEREPGSAGNGTVGYRGSARARAAHMVQTVSGVCTRNFAETTNARCQPSLQTPTDQATSALGAFDHAHAYASMPPRQDRVASYGVATASITMLLVTRPSGDHGRGACH